MNCGLQQLGYEADDLTVASYPRPTFARCIVTYAMRATKGLVQTLGESRMRTKSSLFERPLQESRIPLSKCCQREIQVGMTEKEVALLVDSTMRKLGADKEAFDTIAAFGPNAACPHASPTDAVIEPGGLLKLDFGARRQHYNSDITRTICIGKPTAKHEEVYGIVLEAQLKAIDAIRPGKTGKEIDAVARGLHCVERLWQQLRPRLGPLSRHRGSRRACAVTDKRGCARAGDGCDSRAGHLHRRLGRSTHRGRRTGD